MYYFGVLFYSVNFVKILRNFVKSFYWKQSIKCHYMSNISSVDFAFHNLHAQPASFPAPRTNVPSLQGHNLLLHMFGLWSSPCSGRMRHCTAAAITDPDTFIYCCNSDYFDIAASACGIVRSCCTNGCIP